MKYSRCKWVLLLLAAALASSANAGPQKGVPLARDLRSAADQAEAACIPLLLEFAADYCEYCVLLEEEVLKPMLLDRDYDRRVLVRKLTIDQPARLRDFAGHRVTAAQLAERYRISVTPTPQRVQASAPHIGSASAPTSTKQIWKSRQQVPSDFSVSSGQHQSPRKDSRVSWRTRQ